MIKYDSKCFTPEIFVASIVDQFVNILQLCTMVSSWLIFAFRQKKVQNIIDNIQNNDEIGRKLGLQIDKAEMFQSIAI